MNKNNLTVPIVQFSLICRKHINGNFTMRKSKSFLLREISLGTHCQCVGVGQDMKHTCINGNHDQNVLLNSLKDLDFFLK